MWSFPQNRFPYFPMINVAIRLPKSKWALPLGSRLILWLTLRLFLGVQRAGQVFYLDLLDLDFILRRKQNSYFRSYQTFFGGKTSLVTTPCMVAHSIGLTLINLCFYISLRFLCFRAMDIVKRKSYTALFAKLRAIQLSKLRDFSL